MSELSDDYLDQMEAHVSEDGRLTHGNAVDLLRALKAERKRTRMWRDCFAEITAKATPFGCAEDDPERITSYIIPVGPIHRAAGKTGFQFFGGEEACAKWQERAYRAEAALVSKKEKETQTPSRSGKLLSALAGHVANYRPDVTEVRSAINSHDALVKALEWIEKRSTDEFAVAAAVEGLKPFRAALQSAMPGANNE